MLENILYTDEIMKSLFKNSIFNILYTLLNIIFPFLTSIIASRILLPGGIGKVASAQNFASYFVAIASLGLPVYGIKAVAQCQNDSGKIKNCFTELLIINMIMSAVSTVVYVVLILSIDSFKEEILLYMICGIQVLFNIFNIDWLYKGKEEYSYIVIRSLIVKIASFIALLLFVKTISDYCVYALITALALVGNYAFNIWHARSYVVIGFKGLDFKQHIKPLIILGISVVFATLYSKIDITMLGIMTNDETVGLYNNAHKSINIILSFVTAITAVFLPRLSTLCGEEKTGELCDLVNKGLKIILLFAIPIFVGVLILSPYLIKLLYGEAFLEASLSMRVFSGLILICSVGDLVCYQLLIAIGYERKRAIANIGGAVINVTMNAILIPIMKAEGAAIASVFSEFCLNTYLFIVVRKMVNIKLITKSFIKYIIASGIMGIMVFIITLICKTYWLAILVGVIVGICIYFSMLLIMREESLHEVFRKMEKRTEKEN